MDKNVNSRLFWVIDWACRLVIAAVFLLAAVPKLLDHQSFAKAMVNYRVVFPLIGQNYIFAMAMFMPALEGVAAIALLLNRWKKAGAAVCGGLLVLFIVLIAQATLRGFNIDCGCFGAGKVGAALAQKVGIDKILEDALWLLMCVFVWWRGGKNEG